MTESPSEDEDVVLNLDGMRAFTAVTMEVYRQAAVANYAEAEELLERAMALRDAGHAILDRAATLAYEYAEAERSVEARLEVAFLAEQELDDIAW